MKRRIRPRGCSTTGWGRDRPPVDIDGPGLALGVRERSRNDISPCIETHKCSTNKSERRVAKLAGYLVTPRIPATEKEDLQSKMQSKHSSGHPPTERTHRLGGTVRHCCSFPTVISHPLRDLSEIAEIQGANHATRQAKKRSHIHKTRTNRCNPPKMC